MNVISTRIYTRNEVMKLLKTSNYTMTKIVAQEKLIPVKVGKAYRFLGSEILRFMSVTETKG